MPDANQTALSATRIVYPAYRVQAIFPSGRTEHVNCGTSIARAQAERLYYERLGARVRVLGLGAAVKVA